MIPIPKGIIQLGYSLTKQFVDFIFITDFNTRLTEDAITQRLFAVFLLLMLILPSIQQFFRSVFCGPG